VVATLATNKVVDSHTPRRIINKAERQQLRLRSSIDYLIGGTSGIGTKHKVLHLITFKPGIEGAADRDFT
jgi:hypothetical protein